MDNINLLIQMMKDSKYSTVFTGAGVSTLSGIRDFRGKNGLYNEYDADRLFSLTSFKNDPSYFYKHAKNFIYDIDDILPSIVHNTCATLEHLGVIKKVITQNIDQLHSIAGSKDVLELHGSAVYHTCGWCKKKYKFEDVKLILDTEEIPHCECCGVLKPDIIFFQEELNEEVFNAAYHEAEKSSLMIVVGTSLIVHPASNIPRTVLKSGGKIVIVNDQPTPLDEYATLKFSNIEEVFTSINNFIEESNIEIS